MNELKFVFQSRQQVLDMSAMLLKNSIKESEGQSTMSPDAVKLSLLAIQGTLEHQADVIAALYRQIEKMHEPKPSLFRRIFKK